MAEKVEFWTCPRCGEKVSIDNTARLGQHLIWIEEARTYECRDKGSDKRLMEWLKN